MISGYGTSAATGRGLQAAPNADEYVAPWVKATRAQGGRRITRRSRRIKIAYEPTCEAPLSRIDVARKPNSVVITVLLKKVFDPAYAIPSCPVAFPPSFSTVSLRGRLGRRSIKDAAFTPPRTVVKRPKRQ